MRPKHGGNLTWAAALAGCSPSEILDFSASINPLGPPETAIAAIQTHLGSLTSYPDPDYRGFKIALSRVHSPLEEDWILPGNGAAELLTWVARDLSELSATYLLTPAFGDYRRALNAFNVPVLEYPIWRSQKPNNPSDGEIVLSMLNASSSTSHRQAGILLNNPHNPTGQLMRQESILPLLERFALVVVDEAFMDFLLPHDQQSLIPWVTQYPNLVVLRSLTKFYSLPGLRLGYAIAHPDRLRRWQQWRDPWPVNGLAVAAGIAVLEDYNFQQQTWDWLTQTRPLLFQGLANLPQLHPYPGAANFLFVASQQPVPQLQSSLLQHHRILIRDCLSFPELGDRYFRVAIRTSTDNQRLLNALCGLTVDDFVDG